MQTHLMSMYKKITAVIVLILFSFILFAPTSNALQYDPDNYKYRIIGDIDPWEENRVSDPPPDDDDDRIVFSLSDFKIGFTTYLYFKIGWNWNSTLENKQIDDAPINSIHITTPDDSENNSKQTIRNR